MASPETYASLITPLGEGGIGIIALWGPRAVAILDGLFHGTRRRAAELALGHLAHGTIQRNGETIDEVILARTRPPAAVGQPWFEVNCHGGVMAVRAVLDCLEQAGAHVLPWRRVTGPHGDPALADETVRALALSKLPGAPTRLAARMLLHQLDGALSGSLDEVERLLERGDAAGARATLAALLETAPLGRALLQPPRVAFLGPPNAGKSTLFNALLQEERVIVHHEPGTTRDVVRETVSVRGVPFELMDAAGIGPARDELEEEAIGRAMELARKCEVAVFVFDLREGPDAAPPPAVGPDVRLIRVANKEDLTPEGGWPQAAEQETVRISAKHRTNLNAVEDALLQPYADLLEDCRRGGPVLFAEGIERAVRRVARLVETSGAPDALAELRSLRGREQSG